MRELVYQLDVWLDNSTLYVNVTLTNINAHEVPVYWWTNIAVPEREGTRVLAPATEAWHLNAGGVLNRVSAPSGYTDGFAHAADYFYDIPATRQPWIAALDRDGTGLLQTSTANLRGRKLFIWGRSNGSKRWQEWLSPPGHAYLEIQAGLARTQLEHLPIPAGKRWSWLESYSLITLDPALAHGDLSEAVAGVDALIAPLPSTDPSMADLAPAEILHRGSGWGALETHIRPTKRRGASPGGLDLPGTPFADETLGRDQASWLALLKTGTMPAPAPRLAPASYQVSPQWRERLERASPHNWFTLMHLGVARWHAGDQEAAIDAWQQSHASAANPWALRNLAFATDDAAAAAEQLRQAHVMVPWVRAIAVETIQALLESGRPTDALTLIDRLTRELRMHGRIRLLECWAALAAGRLDRAAQMIDAGIFVDDLREGEDALHDLWFSYHAERRTTPAPDLPWLYDFRIRTEQDEPASNPRASHVAKSQRGDGDYSGVPADGGPGTPLASLPE